MICVFVLASFDAPWSLEGSKVGSQPLAASGSERFGALLVEDGSGCFSGAPSRMGSVSDGSNLCDASSLDLLPGPLCSTSYPWPSPPVRCAASMSAMPTVVGTLDVRVAIDYPFSMMIMHGQ